MDGLTPGRVVTGRGTRLPTVAGYVATVRSHVGAVLVLAVLGMLAGGFVAHQKPVSYKANAFILLPDVPTYVDLDPEPPTPGRTTIDTTSVLVFSDPVYRDVSSATGIAADKVPDRLSVSAYPLSRVLIVTFTARTRDQAVDGANAAAETVSDERTSLPGAQTLQADALSSELDRLRDLSRERVRTYSPQTQALTNEILHLQDSVDAGQAAAGRLVNRADLDSVRRVKSHPELQVVTGLMVGLLIGIGYSWWRRDKHLHHDSRIIGLAAKVRPHRRSGPRSRPPARGRRPRPSPSPGQ
jgi:capsular polysaccharide biosynthesis protein